MKTNYILIILALISVLSVSCIREEMTEDMNSSVELTARMEYEADTKTSLSGLQNGMYYPLWSAGDEIAVFVDGASTPSKFILQAGEGSTVASFAGTEEGDSYVALYPYDMAESLSDGTLTLTLPQTQEYAPDSFGQGAFPMVATGDSDGMLKFMNLCSVLKITFTGTAAIRSITVTANDKDTYLSGPALVDATAEKNFLSMAEGASNSVVLECKGAKVEETPDFHIVIPSQTYKGGLTVEVDTYTDKIAYNFASDIVFERSQIRTIKNFQLDSDVYDPNLQLEKERDALIAFYNAMDGENWRNKDGWCSDKPVGEWYGVDTGADGYVVRIDLINNNLSGYLPDAITDLLSLNGLNLRSSDIKGNPFHLISRLKNLKNVQLGSCNICCEIPVEICNMPNLHSLSLHDNIIYGSIPSEIGNLSQLNNLDLPGNSLSGYIPESICDLTNLNYLELGSNKLSGNLPEELSKLKALNWLGLDNNELSGVIPSGIDQLTDIEYINLSNNNFTGVLPIGFQDMTVWAAQWGNIVYGNDLDLSQVIIPAPEFMIAGNNDDIVTSGDVYSSNKCVVFIKWEPYAVRLNELKTGKDLYMAELNRIYNLYHEDGLEIIGYCMPIIKPSMGYEAMERIIDEYDIKWPNYYRNTDDVFTGNGIDISMASYPYPGIPSIIAINTINSTIGFSYLDFSLPFRLEEYIIKQLDVEFDYYTSIDYSSDGTVETLQTATKGNGINIVLMGDGYSDRQIADGTYKADMEFAYRNLFTEEPYKSHQDKFNVSYVNVVSMTEGYEYGGNTLGCQFGGGTYVYGNDALCFEYAQKVVAEEDMDETLVVVVMNSDAYAGTCFMYNPSDVSMDYGSGASVAYFPKGSDETMFAQLLHHEANGHGFAKLADEYAYEDMGAVPSDYVTEILDQQNNWGWWKNVDFTDDPKQVRWANFLEDERYANEGLGLFEGGLTYWTGVWRPTETSIMVNNAGEFNAPSREAIYYRIHKLAYGDSWEYDYEKFVEYDAVNRTSASADAPQKRRTNYVENSYEPLAPPVIVGKTWKEAQK